MVEAFCLIDNGQLIIDNWNATLSQAEFGLCAKGEIQTTKKRVKAKRLYSFFFIQ